MYRGGKGFDDGRGGGGKNGWYGYRRDYRQAYRGGWGDRMDSSSHAAESSMPSEPAPVEHEKSSEQSQSSSSSEAVIARLEKRLASVQKEFKHAVQEKNKKENDKFDLIFGILSELQGRQARLEELINGLWNQHAASQMAQVDMASNHMGQPQQAQQMQFGSMPVGQNFGHMGGQMNMHATGNMQQQQMQQFAGMMQPDGSQTIFAVQQVSQPVAGGMQPAAQQLMAPAGQMQAMMPPSGQMQQPQMLPGAQPHAGSASKEQSTSRSPGAPGRENAGRAAGGKRLANVSMERSTEGVNGTSASNLQQAEVDVVDTSEEAPVAAASSTESNSHHYTKNRTWRVTNLQEQGELKDTAIPLVSVAKAFCPDIATDPREDLVVRWLKKGDVVRQIGHSKKVKGFMVMPVRFSSPADGAQCDEDEQDGWVTRSSPDKTSDGEGVWFEEVHDL